MDFSSSNQAPLFVQIAKYLEDAIFTGLYPEGGQIPSTTEISAHEHINPATVLKGMNILVDRGWIEKRRGLGMFVCEGARESIRARRLKDFGAAYVAPMKREADKLGIGRDEVVSFVMEAFDEA